MAKGKKSSGKNYTSTGRHSNVSASTRRLMRSSKTAAQKFADKQAAWLKGGNPWVTIANPNREETNKPFVRVRMNDLMHGTSKDRQKKMFKV